MRVVYSHSAATIAATAAENGDKGVFLERNPEEIPPLPLNPTWDSESSWDNTPAGVYGLDRERVSEAPNQIR